MFLSPPRRDGREAPVRAREWARERERERRITLDVR
jgi:hypothetical protein